MQSNVAAALFADNKEPSITIFPQTLEVNIPPDVLKLMEDTGQYKGTVTIKKYDPTARLGCGFHEDIAKSH